MAILSLALAPQASQGAGLDLIGQSNLGGEGLNGEVAVSGDTAVVASGILRGQGVRSSFRGTYPCPATTVKVVDLSTPSDPRVASRIPIARDTVASDVDLLRVNTANFSGDLAAIAFVLCNASGNFQHRGVAYYDVTNRANPQFLGRYQADLNRELPTDPPCGPDPNPNDTDTSTAERCADSQDQVALVQRADGRVLSLSTEPFSSNSQGTSFPTPNAAGGREDFHGDLRIVDVTNPRAPVEVGSYPNGPAVVGGPDQRFPGFGAQPVNQRLGQSNNGCRPFDSGYGPGAFPDGTKGLLTYFDYGLITVDLANPAAPSTIGQWSYDRNNRALEGNAGYVDFASVGGRALALVGETDWIAPNTSLRLDAPSSIAGSMFACESLFTLYDPEDDAQIYRKPGSQVPGEIVYVGRGCPQDPIPDVNGKIAFRETGVLPPAEVPRQTGLSAAGCTPHDASKRLEVAGARGTVVGAVPNAAGTARVQTFLGENEQPVGGLSTPTIGLDIPETTRLRNALCPVPTTPPTGTTVTCGAGGQPQTGAMVDSPGEWGNLRVVDVTNPANPTLRGTYRPPRARVFPPPDRGIYSVHHAVARGSEAYVAAHADGVRVVDLASPSLPETASFVPPDRPDPTGSIPPKAHVTGVDAGPGGTIVISDMNTGLYVLRATPRAATQPTPPSDATACPALTANLIRGTAAGESINGTPRADRILAGAGNDVVDGLAGDDCLDLGAGTDRGQGGDGGDLLFGGLGTDRLSGNLGHDVLRGGSSGDRLIGGFGNDRLFGESGSDRLNGERGRDRISGGSSGDVISAGSSGDRVAGGAGGDRINGNSGNDSLSGNSGNDRISGSSGNDRIAGGSGGDRISARDGRRDRINCGSGRDRVLADRVDRVAGNCEVVRGR